MTSTEAFDEMLATRPQVKATYDRSRPEMQQLARTYWCDGYLTRGTEAMTETLDAVRKAAA